MYIIHIVFFLLIFYILYTYIVTLTNLYFLPHLLKSVDFLGIMQRNIAYFIICIANNKSFNNK